MTINYTNYKTKVKKIIHLSVSKHNFHYNYTIDFINVIGCSMSACDFWGASERIFGIQHLEEDKRVLLPLLETKWKSEDTLIKEYPYKNRFEVEILFVSGDFLNIACETIIVDDRIHST